MDGSNSVDLSNIKFSEHKKKKLTKINESEKTFKLQKNLSYNIDPSKKVTIDNISSFFKKGWDLWAGVIDKAQEKFNAGEAILYRTKPTVADKYQFLIYDGKKNIRQVLLSNTEDVYIRMIEDLSEFFNDDDCINEDNKDVYIATGEGSVFIYCAELLTKKLLERLEKQHANNGENTKTRLNMISGPIMTYKGGAKTEVDTEVITDIKSNNMLYQLKCKYFEPDLYRNNLVQFDMFYAGYFHFYTVGNTVFAETPHRLMDNRKTIHRFIFNDESIANELRSFFHDYTKAFCEPIYVCPEFSVEEQIEHLQKFYTAIDIRKERVSVDGLKIQLQS